MLIYLVLSLIPIILMSIDGYFLEKKAENKTLEQILEEMKE